MLVADLQSDSYYNKEYAKLYLKSDEEKLFEYVYQENSRYVIFRSIKRPIIKIGNVFIDEELYDLETPYGYGGPLANTTDTVFLQRAFQAYRVLCKQKNIVCEFIRFHPFNPISEQSALFDMCLPERNIVVVDLDNNVEERRKLYSKTTRNIVKKAETRLMVEKESVKIDDFMGMYYETMQKNLANDFFYFKEDYFEKLMKLDGVSLLATKLGDTYVSIGFFMCGKDLAHYHLSANNQDFSRENGNYLLLDAAFEYAKEKGCRYMMLGGGRTSSIDDSLFKFKSKFSPFKMPFFIAGLDFLPEKRQELNKLWCQQNQESQVPKLFQLYRA